jgi:hypothetical protein
MKIGNIIASIGIILGFLGFICMPLYNFHELPYSADPGSIKGAGWKILMQTGLFSRPGLFLLVLGVLMFFGAKLLPKQFWATKDDLPKELTKRKKIKKP